MPLNITTSLPTRFPCPTHHFAFRIALALSTVIGPLGLGPRSSEASDEITQRIEKTIEIAAKVGTEIITTYDVEQRLAGFLAVNPDLRHKIADPGEADTIKLRLLNTMVDERVIAHHLAKINRSVTSKDVDAEIENVKRMNNITDAQLKSAIRQNGKTFQAYRKEMQRQIERYRFTSIVVRPNVEVNADDVRKAYDQKYANRTEVIKANFRVIRIHCDTPKHCADRTQMIASLLSQGTPFEEVAKNHSDSPTAVRGGEFGWVDMNDISPAFQSVLRKQSPGEISSEIRIGHDVYFLQLIARNKEPQQSFEAVKATLREQLFQERLEKTTNNLIAKYRGALYIWVNTGTSIKLDTEK